MPNVFLSPSTQEWNPYVNGGSEEFYMNQIADRMEPYLRSSGISYTRNDPNRNAAGAIADSNDGSYDVHLALHSNAAPEAYPESCVALIFTMPPAVASARFLQTFLLTA